MLLSLESWSFPRKFWPVVGREGQKVGAVLPTLIRPPAQIGSSTFSLVRPGAALPKFLETCETTVHLISLTILEFSSPASTTAAIEDSAVARCITVSSTRLPPVDRQHVRPFRGVQGAHTLSTKLVLRLKIRGANGL